MTSELEILLDQTIHKCVFDSAVRLCKNIIWIGGASKNVLPSLERYVTIW